MKKIIPIIFVGLFVPLLALAQSDESSLTEDIIEAEVIEIIDQTEITREDGSVGTQQDIKLKGLGGDWKDKEFTFYGISEIDVISSNVYEEGDKVLVIHTKDIDDNDLFYVFDYIRRGQLYWLAIIFSLVIILIGKWKGFRSLISLLITFLIILKFIVPKILSGSSPVLIAVTGSFFILVLIVYITEGLSRKSHLAVASILISLLITGLLSVIFTSLARLTGMAQEEIMYLIGVGNQAINFRGLLLAGILIGTLGVLDDVVISQIEAVGQIKSANPNLSKKEVFNKAFKVGKSHMGSMVNTLFLAYAGASLPLLLLFSLKEPPFLNFSQVINNEIIATEVVRTLVGSIGLALAIPIATFLAAKYYTNKTHAQAEKMQKNKI